MFKSILKSCAVMAATILIENLIKDEKSGEKLGAIFGETAQKIGKEADEIKNKVCNVMKD